MFCSKCGKEISDTASFCKNCGQEIIRNTNNNNKYAINEKIKFNDILNNIKKYLTDFSVDYNSKLLKFAMIIFLSIGIGKPLFNIINSFSTNIYELFSGVYNVFEFLVCMILFGVFSILILKLKNKEKVKKSNILMILWIVFTFLNILDFIIGIELHQYILFPNYFSSIVNILCVIFSVTIILKNKYKYPIIIIISAISFVLSQNSLWWIKLDISLYEIYKTSEYLLNILSSLRFILLIVTTFLLAYLIPKKISKWLINAVVLAVVIISIFELFKKFNLTGIFDFVNDIFVIAMIVFMVLSCKRDIKYNYNIECKDSVKKSVIKISAISASLSVFIVVTYLLVSAIVCSISINRGIEKWETKIIKGELNRSEQWDEMNGDIFKYNCTKFVSQFIDNYSFYDLLRENKGSMQKIVECYSAYKSGSINDEVVEDYYYISADESWEYDSVLSGYYNKYIEMQPDIDEVDVSAYIDTKSGKIEITVKNKNDMPISKCIVKCDFTIMFIEAGYYSDVEYGRGSRTIEVENIGGNSEVEETILFNSDDYYDGYGSYIVSSLFDKSISIISIE